MSAPAAKQAQLRAMMAAAKASASSARVSDRLAKYDANGGLSCAICRTSLTADQWPHHVASRAHNQTLGSLRELARSKAAAASGASSTAGASSAARPAAAAAPAPAFSSGAAKSSGLSSGSVTTTVVVKKLATAPPAPAPSAAPAAATAASALPAGLPADFFSTPAPPAPATSVAAAAAVPRIPPAPAAVPATSLGLGAYDDDDDEAEDAAPPPAAATTAAAGALPMDFFDSVAAPAASPYNAPTAAAALAVAAAAGSDGSASAAPTPAPTRSAPAGAALKTSSAFVVGASASFNPLMAASAANAAAAAAAKPTIASKGSAPSGAEVAPLSLSRARDLSAEHAAFEDMLRVSAAEAELQAKKDAVQLAAMRKREDRDQEAQYGDRLADLKRASEATKKRLAAAKEERARKRAKIPTGPAAASASPSVPPVVPDDADNPFLDWRG